MANKKIKGITVEIGGNTTQLGKALKDVESNTSSLKGELKDVDKMLKFDPENVTLVSQKQKILTDAVEETSQKLKILKDSYAQVFTKFSKGEIGEDQFRSFQREIIKTESELNDLQSQLHRTGDDLEDVGNDAEQSGDGFTIMKGALADLVSNAIQGAISKIGDLVGALFELNEATKEYRSMQSKLEGSANSYGYSLEFANSKYKEFYKYVGDDQMATNAITNLMGLGTSTENVSALAEGAIGVWASYGDSIPIESLTESINETIQVGKVTGVMADTINWATTSNETLEKALSGNSKAQKAFNDALDEGLPVEDAFSEALAKISDEQERADVVAQFLNSTYGESKKTYDETAKSILDTNEAELDLKDTQAQLGETMAPVNNALTDMKNKALEAIAPLVEKLVDGFMKLYDWFQKHPTAMKIVTGVVIALASAFTVLATALAIQGIITGVTKAIALLNGTLLANPIVLIIAGIVALVAGIIYLWNNCEAFRNAVKKIFDGIKKAVETVINFLVKLFTETIPNALKKMINWFKELPTKIGNAISRVFERISTWVNNVKTKMVNGVKNVVNSVTSWFKQLPGKIWSAIVGAVSKIASWGSQMLSKAKSAIKKVTSAIVNGFKSVPSKLAEVGKNLVQGLWNGIKNMTSWIKDKIKGFGESVVQGLKSFFGIKSPSRVMRDQVGKYIAEGIGTGITENADVPLDALKTLGDDMANQELALNGATINRQLSATFSGGQTSQSNNGALLSKLDAIYDRLNRLQIVLDSGTLVGETIDLIDTGLANKQLLINRGV